MPPQALRLPGLGPARHDDAPQPGMGMDVLAIACRYQQMQLRGAGADEKDVARLFWRYGSREAHLRSIGGDSRQVGQPQAVTLRQVAGNAADFDRRGKQAEAVQPDCRVATVEPIGRANQ